MAEEIVGPGKKERRKRRPRGSGGLVERKPFWQIIVTLHGKRIEETSRCTRRKDAQDLLDRVNAALRAGTFTSIAAIRDGVPDAGPVSVATVADQWLELYAKVMRDEKGYVLAGARVERFFKPFLGDLSAGKLTTDNLRAYRGWLSEQKRLCRCKDGKYVPTERPLTTQTQRHVLSDARCLVLWAAERGLVPPGIVPRHFLPKNEEKPLRSLTPDQQTTVRAVEEPYGFAVRLILDSGVRWSELCRLTRDDLVDGELVIHGKTKSRRMRTVPVPPALVAEIKQHVGKLVRFELGDNTWFTRAVRAKSGVGAFTAHGCRHSYAFNYMAHGGNVVVLQANMGHASIGLTAHYARPSREARRADAAKVHAAG
jgi:integrase